MIAAMMIRESMLVIIITGFVLSFVAAGLVHAVISMRMKEATTYNCYDIIQRHGGVEWFVDRWQMARHLKIR